MQYMINEIDYDKCVLTTLEGKRFGISPYEISLTIGWCPTGTITLIRHEGRLYLRYYDEKLLVRVI